MPTSTDTLVIGAGAAGLFAALRWAERGSVTVIEAGPDAGDPPPRWALYDYALPEAHYYRYTDTRTGQPIPQGRGLGGGSTVNSAAALRGQPWCYDGWQVPGWSWAEVLAGFRGIEADQQFPEAGYHGADGLIPITRLDPGPLDEAVFGWCRDAGHPAVDDHNAPGALGYGVWTTNRRDGGRWGTYAGVVPAARRAGVRIRPDTAAGRLVFDGSRCVGAEVTGPDGPDRISAGRVIVCAGAYGSPTLLLRSGLGPEDALARLGADPVAILPGVGANLADHPWCLLDVDVTDPALIEARPVSGALLRYELDSTHQSHQHSHQPHQSHQPHEPDQPGEHREAEIFPWQTRPYDLTSPPTRVSFTAALMAPRSRGRFELRPDGPWLDVAHLADDADAANMAEIVATTAELLESLAKEGVLTIPDDAWWRADDLVAASRAAVSSYH
ncbi:MAG TPA: GMC family oxidoreductase, partial [Streptosporangiaceae bacterium]|nr:GMC family oxidoreductase [Streptosporangiaceae bacterium]